MAIGENGLEVDVDRLVGEGYGGAGRHGVIYTSIPAGMQAGWRAAHARHEAREKELARRRRTAVRILRQGKEAILSRMAGYQGRRGGERLVPDCGPGGAKRRAFSWLWWLSRSWAACWGVIWSSCALGWFVMDELTAEGIWLVGPAGALVEPASWDSGCGSGWAGG